MIILLPLLRRLSVRTRTIVGSAVTNGTTAMRAPALRGLRERAAALGAVVDAGPRETSGWRLAVTLRPGVRAR